MSSAARIEELERKNAELGAQLDSLKQQLDWFKRQIFGRKSEQRLHVDLSVQGNLLRDLGVANPPPKDEPVETISYQRRKRQRDGAVNDSGLRFGEDVPREIIAASAEALALIGALYRHEEILRERG